MAGWRSGSKDGTQMQKTLCSRCHTRWIGCARDFVAASYPQAAFARKLPLAHAAMVSGAASLRGYPAAAGLTLNQSEYSAGRKNRVISVPTSVPPISTKAIGPH